jgi:hypothetical protein
MLGLKKIMGTKTRYCILPELNLIIEYYSGIIGVEEIKNLELLKNKDKEYNGEYNIILDMSDAEFNLDENDIDEVSLFMQTNKDSFGKRKCAFITKTPNQVVSPMLYKSQIKFLPMKYEVFSTMNASLKFINVSRIHKKYIKNIIKNLKKE